jgi:SAM-dependent methyltransferase
MADWNTIFKREGRFFQKPQEDMIGILALLKRSKAERILDLGCGSGRHVVLFARKGLNVTGLDISSEALRLARRWMRDEGLRARFVKASCFEPFPFTDGSFDAIVSVQVIHHARHADIRRSIKEMRRVLRPGGLLFVSVPDTHVRRDASRFLRPEPRTLLPLDGLEAGVLHYIYNRAVLRKDFKEFEILDLHKDSKGHFCLIARKRTDDSATIMRSLPRH